MVGAVERVRPKMMTVVAIMAGLVPILWSTGAGSEVMQRIAVPMIGGWCPRPCSRPQKKEWSELKKEERIMNLHKALEPPPRAQGAPPVVREYPGLCPVSLLIPTNDRPELREGTVGEVSYAYSPLPFKYILFR